MSRVAREAKFVPTKIYLKLWSCKLGNDKDLLPSAQITNTEIFAFAAILVFKSFISKVLFINREDI